MIRQTAESAKFIMKSVQKELDDMENRINRSHPADAIRITGPSTVERLREQVASAEKLVESLKGAPETIEPEPELPRRRGRPKGS